MDFSFGPDHHLDMHIAERARRVWPGGGLSVDRSTWLYARMRGIRERIKTDITHPLPIALRAEHITARSDGHQMQRQPGNRNCASFASLS